MATTTPTAAQIAAAYATVSNAERATLVALKEAGTVYMQAIDAASAGLPLTGSPVSPSLQNIASWKNTIASIVASVESYLNQYPDPNANTEETGS